MTLDQIYKYCKFVMQKDQLGEPANPADFSILLKVVNAEFFDAEWKKVVQVIDNRQVVNYDMITAGSPLYNLVMSHSETTTATTVSLPSDFGKVITASAVYYAGEMPIDTIVGVFDERRLSIISGDVTEQPIGYISSSDYEYIPAGATKFKMSYIKFPGEPYYDYVISTVTDEYIYMPVGSTFTGTNLMQGSVLLASNVIHPSGTPSHTSETVELVWDDMFHNQLADLLIEKMSVSSREIDVTQYSQMKKQE